VQVTCNKYSSLGEKLFTATMDNGLHCIFIPKPGFKRKFAVLATPYGAINRHAKVRDSEFTTPAGVAHFLEHKLFEDPKESIENRFAALGSSVNAYTSHASTAYLFSTAEHFSQSLELLLDFVQTPSFTPEGVESEKSIIAQEITMYNDQPNWRVYLGALQGLYGSHPVAEDIAGQVADLEEIDWSLLKKCHELFYHPSRMVLAVAGDLDATRLFEQIEANQRKKKFPSLPQIQDLMPKVGDVVKRETNAHMEVARPLFTLGMRDKQPADYETALRRELLASLFLEIYIGKNSPFYNRLYDEGLIDSSFGIEYTSTPWYSHFIFGGESDQPEKLTQELLNEIRRLQQAGIPKEQFEQNLRKLTGLYIMDLNGLESLVMTMASDFLQGSNYLDKFEELIQISHQDVMEFLNSLQPDKNTLSVVRPLNQ
jgi:predicted Zn-dependent peptidase